MVLRPPPSRLVAVCVLVTFLLALLLRHLSMSSPWSTATSLAASSNPMRNYLSLPAGSEGIDTASEIGRASNRSLGFEKVFVLGLKHREDRRDAMVLSASLTGFDLELVDGLKSDEVAADLLPPGVHLHDGVLGSWRSHLNLVRSVVENNIASALIMEDDVDWDIRLLSQLPEFAKGVRALTSTPTSARQYSPYGDDWDILWPGHCGDILHKEDKRKYIIEKDQTVAPKAHQPWLKALKEYPEGTRLVHRAGAPICTFAYAISYRGAQKILMALAIKGGVDMAFDNLLSELCRDGYLDTSCYSVEPQLFNHHRAAGTRKDSDINSNGKTKTREKGFTEAIVLSIRLNLEKVLLGSQDYIKQW